MSAIAQLPPKQLRWQKNKSSSLARQREVFSVAFTFLFLMWWDKFWQNNTSPTRHKRADWLVRNMLELGPTFIKIGQSLSTRIDLLPPEYISSLAQLQDKVPAFSVKEAREIIELELGKSIYNIYRDFDEVPLAAASLGQVHRATLYSGEEVVVKVQRPGLKRLFDLDLLAVGKLVKVFRNYFAWTRKYNLEGIYKEFFTILYQEIDYAIEASNADRFRKNFTGYPRIIVPKVYWEYSTSMVLTLEYVPGIKIDDRQALEACGLNPKEINQLGICCYLKQFLQDGFFHADPHPGNVAIDPKTGALIFYDFGMMGRIAPGTKEKLMDTLLAIAGRNADRVVRGLVGLGAISAEADTDPIRRSVQYLLDNFLDKPLESQSVAQITDDLYDIAYGQPFRFPATFTFVMRAFSTIEGVGKGLDPDFNFMEAAQPFAFQIMNSNGNSTPDANAFLAEIGRQAAQVGSSALGLPRRLEDTIDKLERGDIRVRVRSSETDRYLRRLGTMQQNTNYAILVATFTLSATMLFVNQYTIAAGVVGAIAAISLVVWFRQMRKLDRQDRMS